MTFGFVWLTLSIFTDSSKALSDVFEKLGSLAMSLHYMLERLLAIRFDVSLGIAASIHASG